MRLGIIALEAPPEAGGMQEHARGLLRHLPPEVEIQLYTRPGCGFAREGLTVVDRLEQGGFEQDRTLLAAARVDAWLVLNAGALAHADALAAPVFAYVHGKDFTAPWYPSWRAPTLADRLRMPGRSHLFRRWRMQRIGEGLRRSRHAFANSNFTRERLCAAFGLDPARVGVAAPGIDERHLQPLVARPPGPLRLLTVSRLSVEARRKNVEGVLRALALIGEGVDWRYEVAGSGDDLSRLQALSAQLGLGERTGFLGRVSDEDLRAAYARADVFVLAVTPDPTDIEGFGMVYAEAAGAGVPSIAVRSGGVVDAVVEGRTGRLIDDPSPEGIARAITAFAAERDRYQPEAIQAFARTVTSRATTAQLWAALEARL